MRSGGGVMERGACYEEWGGVMERGACYEEWGVCNGERGLL